LVATCSSDKGSSEDREQPVGFQTAASEPRRRKITSGRLFRACRRSFLSVIVYPSMEEEREENNDRDRDAKHPK